MATNGLRDLIPKPRQEALAPGPRDLAVPSPHTLPWFQGLALKQMKKERRERCRDDRGEQGGKECKKLSTSSRPPWPMLVSASALYEMQAHLNHTPP